MGIKVYDIGEFINHRNPLCVLVLAFILLFERSVALPNHPETGEFNPNVENGFGVKTERQDDTCAAIMSDAQEALSNTPDKCQLPDTMPVENFYMDMFEMMEGYLEGMRTLETVGPVEAACTEKGLELNTMVSLSGVKIPYLWNAPILSTSLTGLLWITADKVVLKVTVTVSTRDKIVTTMETPKVESIENFLITEESWQFFNNVGSYLKDNIFQKLFNDAILTSVPSSFQKCLNSVFTPIIENLVIKNNPSSSLNFIDSIALNEGDKLLFPEHSMHSETLGAENDPQPEYFNNDLLDGRFLFRQLPDNSTNSKSMNLTKKTGAKDLEVGSEVKATPKSNAEPPNANSVPPNTNAVPPKTNAVPPKTHAVPPKTNAVPPNGNAVPPNSNVMPQNNGLHPLNGSKNANVVSTGKPNQSANKMVTDLDSNTLPVDLSELEVSTLASDIGDSGNDSKEEIPDVHPQFLLSLQGPQYSGPGAKPNSDKEEEESDDDADFGNSMFDNSDDDEKKNDTDDLLSEEEEIKKELRGIESHEGGKSSTIKTKLNGPLKVLVEPREPKEPKLNFEEIKLPKSIENVEDKLLPDPKLPQDMMQPPDPLVPQLEKVSQLVDMPEGPKIAQEPAPPKDPKTPNENLLTKNKIDEFSKKLSSLEEVHDQDVEISDGIAMDKDIPQDKFNKMKMTEGMQQIQQKFMGAKNNAMRPNSVGSDFGPGDYDEGNDYRDMDYMNKNNKMNMGVKEASRLGNQFPPAGEINRNQLKIPIANIDENPNLSKNSKYPFYNDIGSQPNGPMSNVGKVGLNPMNPVPPGGNVLPQGKGMERLKYPGFIADPGQLFGQFPNSNAAPAKAPSLDGMGRMQPPLTAGAAVMGNQYSKNMFDMGSNHGYFGQPPIQSFGQFPGNLPPGAYDAGGFLIPQGYTTQGPTEKQTLPGKPDVKKILQNAVGKMRESQSFSMEDMMSSSKMKSEKKGGGDEAENDEEGNQEGESNSMGGGGFKGILGNILAPILKPNQDIFFLTTTRDPLLPTEPTFEDPHRSSTPDIQKILNRVLGKFMGSGSESKEEGKSKKRSKKKSNKSAESNSILDQIKFRSQKDFADTVQETEEKIMSIDEFEDENFRIRQLSFDETNQFPGYGETDLLSGLLYRKNLNITVDANGENDDYSLDNAEYAFGGNDSYANESYHMNNNASNYVDREFSMERDVETNSLPSTLAAAAQTKPGKPDVEKILMKVFSSIRNPANLDIGSFLDKSNANSSMSQHDAIELEKYYNGTITAKPLRPLPRGIQSVVAGALLPLLNSPDPGVYFLTTTRMPGAEIEETTESTASSTPNIQSVLRRALGHLLVGYNITSTVQPGSADQSGLNQIAGESSGGNALGGGGGIKGIASAFHIPIAGAG